MDGARDHPYRRASDLPHCEQANVSQNVQEAGDSSEAFGSVQEQSSVGSHYGAFRNVPNMYSTVTKHTADINLPALMERLALWQPGNRITGIGEMNHGRELNDGVRSMTARKESSARGQGTKSVLRIPKSIVKAGKRNASWLRLPAGEQADVLKSALARYAQRSKERNSYAHQRRAGNRCSICRSTFHDKRQLAQHHDTVHREVCIHSLNARVSARNRDAQHDKDATPIGSARRFA